jgi:hypothetical protein
LWQGDGTLNQEILDRLRKISERLKKEYHAEKVIPHIRKYLGNPKIIILLRNPVDRAFSAYTFLISENREFCRLRRASLKRKKKARWLEAHLALSGRGVLLSSRFLGQLDLRHLPTTKRGDEPLQRDGQGGM